MYETDRKTTEANPNIDVMRHAFTRMSARDRVETIDQLVRIHQSNDRPQAIGREMIGGGVAPTCDAGQAMAPRGITLENLERVFTYQSWAPDQIRQAEPVKEAILALGRAILRNVPDSPDRSVALRKLRELRMDVNAAITHRGEF